MLMGAQFLNFVLSAGMGVTLFLDLLNLWQMYLGAFLIGIAWAIDYPVRHSIIRDVVPEKVVVNAMAINVASWMGSAMVGRWVAGWMLDVAGPGGGLLLHRNISAAGAGVRHPRPGTLTAAERTPIESLL